MLKLNRIKEKTTYFKEKDWNVICDVCGGKYKRSEVRRTHDELLVCKEDWDPRHSSEFKQPKIQDMKKLPSNYVRPESEDSYA